MLYDFSFILVTHSVRIFLLYLLGGPHQCSGAGWVHIWFHGLLPEEGKLKIFDNVLLTSSPDVKSLQ